MLGISERIAVEDSTTFCEYSTDELSKLLNQAGVLATVSFGVTPPETQNANDTNIFSGLKLLPPPQIDSGHSAPPATRTEVFRSDSPVFRGKSEDIVWSENQEYLFCGLYSSESEDIETLAENSYLALLGFIADKGFPHILRAWNYFDRINEGEGDAERYKRFCLGRHRAFEQTTNIAHVNVYPSASAVGCDAKGLTVYLIASKSAGQHFENPDQVSAFQYPRQYGPKSPSFARATLQRLDQKLSRLYISGTASIKGHTTQHPHQTAEQVDTTIDNIEQLLKHVQTSALPNSTIRLDALKVYVRHENDLQIIREKVEAHFPGVKTCYLRGDICRSDLNVEIDGVAHLELTA